MNTIAMVDDDVYIGDMVEEVLKKEGYQTLRAYSGTEAILMLEKNTPDLLLLDLMLPGLSGEQVLEKIQDIPVIVISAKVEVQDKVQMLLNGAVDYLTKPFAIEELLARIAVQLRKKEVVKSDIVSWKEIRLSTVSHELFAGDKKVHLTRTEYAILRLLMINPDQVITKSALLEHISEETPDCMESSLKVHMSNLRKKLRDLSGKDYIETVWGIGFKLRDE